MLKRLYQRFLQWALAPVLDPLRVDQSAVVQSIRAASTDFDGIVQRATGNAS